MSLRDELRAEREQIERIEAEQRAEESKEAERRWQDTKQRLEDVEIPAVFNQTVEKIRVENVEGRKEYRYSWSVHGDRSSRAEEYIAERVMEMLRAEGFACKKERNNVSIVGMNTEGYGGTTSIFGGFIVSWED